MHWNVAYWMLFLPKLIKTFPFAIKEYKNKNYTKHNSDTWYLDPDKRGAVKSDHRLDIERHGGLSKAGQKNNIMGQKCKFNLTQLYNTE